MNIDLAAFSSFGGPTTAMFSNVTISGGVFLISEGGLPTAQQHRSLEAELFPNPTTDQFTLNVPQTLEGEAVATLRNQIGQVVEQRQLQQGDVTTDWNVSQLPAGLYFMEVRQEGSLPQVLRVVKQ